MKKAFYTAFVAVFLAVCALPAALTPLFPDSGSREKRTLSDLPALWEDGALNTEFGAQAETWLSEHFAGRSRLVTLHAQLAQRLFATSSEEQVIIGREGWLFYTPTLEDFLGTQPYTAREQFALACVQRLMQEYVEGQGARYVTTVAPNKNSLYGEYMPYYTVPAASGSVLAELPAAMAAQGVHYVDLYGLLQAAKPQGQLYHKRDTHWNALGARLGYDALLTALGRAHDPYADAVGTVQTVWDGDLDALLLPAGGLLDEQVVYDIPFERLFSYRGSANVELARVATFALDAGAEGTLLMFRDSFGNALIPYLSAAYADATYLRANPYDLRSVQAGQDVITEIVERNLRALLGPAPVMPAPARDPLPADRTVQGGCTLFTEAEKDSLHVYGALDPALVADDARIYLQPQGGDAAYEAFPCAEALPDGTAAGSGYGFSARLPAGADAAGLCVVLRQNAETIQILPE